ncbi:MAG TPA: condensation domain-containing protein, partial [Pyrinomonadaceae bacterium]|nr:condensation domain-containing protein [Pyrinomonadaceae bacterium]
QVMSRVRAAVGAEVPLRKLFESPTVAGLAAAAEAALREGTKPPPPIEMVSREGRLPLSFAQQRLWFLDQLEPGGTFYNIPVAVKLTGRLDVEAFGRALNEVVRRHEALRTTFATHGEGAAQIIAPALVLPLPLTDLSALPEGQRPAAAAAAVREFSNRPFDLSRGPLLRVGLLRLDDEEHVVMLTTHHIVSDVWSMGLLVQELATLYEAFSARQPSPLEELPVQYADYAVWQREWLRGEVLGSQLAYWRRQLADAPSVLDFPKDRSRHATASFKGARIPVEIPEELVAELKTLSRRESSTLYMTMLAAFAATLRHHAHQDDLLIGTPIVNRKQVEVESLIGFFINTLVLRAKLSGDPSFRELMKRVREVCLGAYAHQDVPFERLVEELKPERSLTHNPLFQASFTLDQFPLREVHLSGLTMSPVELEHGTAQFDLVLHLVDAGDHIAGSLQYRTELFDTATMRDFASQFETVLRATVARPDARLSEIEAALAAEERRRREEQEVEVAAVSLQKLRKVRRRTISPTGLEGGGQG